MTEPTSTEAFMERAIGDCAATFATALAAVGDKRGLFAALARGPATSAELASRADASERYVREWLRAMTAAGYLAQDRDSGRYEIPSALLPVLVEEGGPMFLGGVYQQAFAMLPMMEPLAEAFRAGGGVPQDAYGPDLWEGMERFTNAWFENLLLAEWLPALPRVREKLEGAVSVADVGCGAGRANRQARRGRSPRPASSATTASRASWSAPARTPSGPISATGPSSGSPTSAGACRRATTW